jgi:hypothetical protein
MSFDECKSLPPLWEPVRGVAPASDSPAFFIGGDFDIESVMASLAPSLGELCGDGVAVGTPAERVVPGENVIRIVFSDREWFRYSVIWCDIVVKKEFGGMSLAVRHKKVWAERGIANITVPCILAVVCAGIAIYLDLDNRSPPGPGTYWFHAVFPWVITAGVVGILLRVGVEMCDSLQARRIDFTDLSQRANIMRDSVVARIEQAFRDLRIPEGLIERS